VVPQESAIPTTRTTAQSASYSKQCYDSFISKGFVSVSEHGEKIPMGNLRDTGATQSLFLDGVLPLSDSTAAGTVQI